MRVGFGGASLLDEQTKMQAQRRVEFFAEITPIESIITGIAAEGFFDFCYGYCASGRYINWFGRGAESEYIQAG